MCKFLERHQLLKMSEKETPNKLVISKETQLVIKTTHKQKLRHIWLFLVNSTKHLVF